MFVSLTLVGYIVIFVPLTDIINIIAKYSDMTWKIIFGASQIDFMHLIHMQNLSSIYRANFVWKLVHVRGQICDKDNLNRC